MRNVVVLAVGLCFLVLAIPDTRADEKKTPTYYGDVLGILQKHCQDCHRPGEVAPFALLSYDQAKKRATDLVTVTKSRVMPPWHASTKEGGPFRDARVLSASEISTISDWAEGGCPEGDKAAAPPAKTWASEWPLGKPDLVLTVPEAYKLGAEGGDEFRVFVIPNPLTEDKWISAIDYNAGNAKVVHHILGAYDLSGLAKKKDAADSDSGFKVFGGFGVIPSGGLGGWAPGKRAEHLPEGVGRFLPAKSDVLLQIHYHKSGKPETDATKIAFYFSKKPVDKMVRGGMIVPARSGLLKPLLRIPAGEANYEIKGTATINEDSHLTAVIPHMHWLGKDFTMTAILPDGTTSTLIKINQWDFNWQGTYDFAKPIALPKGTKIEMLAHFDNSAENPSNPSKPPVEVHWGEQTTDEMCIGFFQRTSDKEKLENRPPTQRREAAKPKAAIGRLGLGKEDRAGVP